MNTKLIIIIGFSVLYALFENDNFNLTSMKKSIAVLVSFLFVISMYSQNKVTDPEPKGMVFIPSGSFDMEMTINKETRKRHVTVDAFWMSNEITNGEFREFVDWAKNNPEKKLYQIKYNVTTVTDPVKGSMKDTMIRVIMPIDVSAISSEMTDPLLPENLSKDYKNYFTDNKYNDYPVVGVSFKLAEYFCIWKTDTENEKLREKGQPVIQAYRIPLETEWEYIAQQTIGKKDKSVAAEAFQKVKAGDINDWGLNHFDDNVSEWVIQNWGGGSIIRGGSWKTENSIAQRQFCDPNSKEPYIGFRIVRSYISGKK